MKRINIFISDEADTRLRDVCHAQQVKMGPLIEALLLTAPDQALVQAAGVIKSAKAQKRENREKLKELQSHLKDLSMDELEKLVGTVQKKKK